MIYVVFKPAKNNKEIIDLVTTDLETAKSNARRLRSEYENKGWDNWAKRVRIIQPKEYNRMIELSNELVNKANTLDMMNQGGTFRGNGKSMACASMDTLYYWADLLRKTAKELKVS